MYLIRVRLCVCFLTLKCKFVNFWMGCRIKNFKFGSSELKLPATSSPRIRHAKGHETRLKTEDPFHLLLLLVRNGIPRQNESVYFIQTVLCPPSNTILLIRLCNLNRRTRHPHLPRWQRCRCSDRNGHSTPCMGRCDYPSRRNITNDRKDECQVG